MAKLRQSLSYKLFCKKCNKSSGVVIVDFPRRIGRSAPEDDGC